MTTSFTSISPATISAANVNRRNLVIEMASDGPILFVLLHDTCNPDAVVSTTNYSFTMKYLDYWECPLNFFGKVSGFLDSAGSAAVTEITSC
jgi:hypothetical protein